MGGAVRQAGGAASRRAPIAALLMLAAAGFPVATPGQSPEVVFLDGVSGLLADHVQEERARRGLAPLERRPELDRAAREHATFLAGLPRGKRLSAGKPVQELLSRQGVRRFETAFQHLDLKRGYADPAEAFLRTWQTQDQAWRQATAPSSDAIGLAVVVAPDGWVIFFALVLRDLPDLPSTKALESATFAAVNRVRAEHGLPELIPHKRLQRVARAHSADMARTGYFDHESPSGSDPPQRVRERGIAFRRLAENIHASQHVADPVRAAVDGWMGSEGHRRNILDRGYTHSAMGIAVDEDGTFYFTQLFLLPKERKR